MQNEQQNWGYMVLEFDFVAWPAKQNWTIYGIQMKLQGKKWHQFMMCTLQSLFLQCHEAL